jgi:hypothetical protein
MRSVADATYCIATSTYLWEGRPCLKRVYISC